MQIRHNLKTLFGLFSVYFTLKNFATVLDGYLYSGFCEPTLNILSSDRPLKIMIEDVKVLVPVEVRNAVLGVVMHMNSAFTGPPKPAPLDLADVARRTESGSQMDSMDPFAPKREASGGQGM